MTSHKKNLVLLAATTLVVAACSSHDNKSPMGPSNPVNQAPTIAAVADQSVDQDTVVGPISIAVGDQETAAAMLTVTAGVNSGDVFPADGVVVSGTGATRTLTLTPFEAATGVATIALIVQDAEGASTTSSFKVTVNAKPASVKTVALSTFAKGETDDATVVNGLTFTQDADDPATFEALLPAENP
jgi:hypothetical protein